MDLRVTRDFPSEPVSRTGSEEARQSALGPADPVALAFAAEELRDRTMSLEEAGTLPSVRLIVTTLLVVFAIAALALLFRHEVLAFAKSFVR